MIEDKRNSSGVNPRYMILDQTSKESFDNDNTIKPDSFGELTKNNFIAYELDIIVNDIVVDDNIVLIEE